MTKLEEADFLLIAEDNPADVGLIRLALKKHGIPASVHIVQDGEAAIRFIEQVEADQSAACPSLAVLDLNLPRVSGDEILRRLRASEKWRHVPVIVMSSSLSARDRVDAMELGAFAYFSKPSELDQFLELGAIIRNALPVR
jgi:CheY-like chemotaxis protein